MNDESRLEGLLDKYTRNNITEPEFTELCRLLAGQVDERWLAQRLEAGLALSPLAAVDPAVLQSMLGKVLNPATVPATPVRIRPDYRMLRLAAAAVLIIMAVGAYLLYVNTPKKQPAQAVAVPRDIAPGGDKAVLTLANGQKLVLNETPNGRVAQQGGVKVIKVDGQIRYSGSGDELLYNTISTPRTGQYQLVLADGTRVWLDAESSLRFPTAFTGKDRVVELSGQGYFEVAHNAQQPFRVKVGGMEVEVLGTHFNVMAYGNEPAVKTTLVEGKVKVSAGDRSTLLRPGQQAQLAGGRLSAVPADVEQALAWKNGYFKLDGTSLQEVMRQVERWYGIQVVYTEDIGAESLSGVVSRKQYVSQLLKILEATRVARFELEGNRIVVRK